MKKLLLFLIVMMAWVTAAAQDVIVKKDGSTVLCKIVQVSPTEITYLKWSDLKGPQYIMDSSLVSNINYQDGRQDKLNEPISNNYAPGIQQTGDSQYNDKALLILDIERKKFSPENKKAKTLKIIGWSVGGTITAVGLGLLIKGAKHAIYWGTVDYENQPYLWSGSILSAVGIATLTGCLIKSNQIKKQSQILTSAPILQYEFNWNKGASLSAEIDIIRDNITHNFTPGLGLQFNF